MRTLLRSIPTGFYYKAGGEWTKQAGEAFDFKSVRPAIEFAHRAGLKRGRLAVAFGDAPHTRQVPLHLLQAGIQAAGGVDRVLE